MNFVTLARFGLPAFGLSALLACSSSSKSSGDTADASSPDSRATTQPASDASTPLDAGAPDSTVLDSGATPDTGSTPDTSIAPDTSMTPDTSPPPDTSVPEAGALSFSADIYGPVIQAHCIFCHGPTADGGEGSGEEFGKLDMSSVDAGYANLVGIAAAGGACASADGGVIRVVPGNAAGSLLYQKVNGYTVAPPCGGAMPKSGEIPDGGQALVVQQIQTWIDQGANP